MPTITLSLPSLRRIITPSRIAAAIFAIGLVYSLVCARPAHIADNPALDLLVLGMIAGVLASLRRGPTPYGLLAGLAALVIVGGSGSLFASLNFVVNDLGTTVDGAMINIAVLAGAALIVPAVKAVLLSLIGGDAYAAKKTN